MGTFGQDIFLQETQEEGWRISFRRLRDQHSTSDQPNSCEVEVWAEFVSGNIQKLLEKQVYEACVAADMPKALAMSLLERLESGGQRFLSWEVDGLVTIYLHTDPGPVHAQIISDIGVTMMQAFSQISGAWFEENVRARGSEVHHIALQGDTLWKEPDCNFKHKLKAQIIPGQVSRRSDLVFEVAVQNETGPRCLDEAVWWTENVTASVCVILKVDLQNIGNRWLKPYVTVFLASVESVSKVMRGPVEIGAPSTCLSPGSPGCMLNISSEVFTRDTSDNLPSHIARLDMFSMIANVFEDMGLDHLPATDLPAERRNSLSMEKLQAKAAEKGYTLNPPVTRSTLAWFS